VALRDNAIDFLRQVFGRERAERERAESPSAEAEKNVPSSIYSMWGREDVGGLLTVSQNLMDTFADCEQMDEYPDINCLVGDTKIYIAEGSIIKPVKLHDLAAEGGGFAVLALDIETGKLVTVHGENPRLTANNAPVIAVKLSNGETIKCTKEHKFLKHGTGYMDAAALKKGDKIVSPWAGFSTNQLSVFSYPAPYFVVVEEDPQDAGVADVYDLTTKTHNFVANGVVVHNSANHYFTNDATQPDIDTGRTVWVHSQDHALKEMADTLLHKRLKIEDEIWSMVYTTVKYGNNYEEILVTENGVIGLNSLPVPTMRRVEQSNGSLIGYVQDITGKFTQDAADLRGMLAGNTKIPDHVALFEEWQVLHSRLRGTMRRSPYGVSVANGARWIWKRLVLLEDAMLIYKLTRAPARFAFYIDVTDIPSDKVESFLRKSKQDLRKQKMVNPRCLTGETPVTCLDGKDRSMRELAEEVPKLAADGKHHYVFSYDTERNRVVPGKIVGAALSGKKKPVYRVLLDNGAIVRCTGDHPFLLRNGTYKQAQDLVRGESLMPLYLSRGSKGGSYYWKHKDTGLGKSRYTHQMVAEEILDSDYKSKELNVHHMDENKENNHPSNLELISPAEHAGHRHPIHLQTARKRLIERAQNDPQFQQELYERIRDWREEHPAKLSEANKKAAATKTARADEAYNLIFAMVDQKLHNDPEISSEAMVAWLNGQVDFTRIYSSLPTTIKTEISRGCWTALLQRRGFASFADYKQRVVGTTTRKNGPQKKRRLAVSGRLNHTVVSVTPDGYEDVYDLTVERFHNFALTAGVFVHNTQRLDMRFNPMDNSEDFFIAVREGRELARVEVLQGPDYQATDDVDYFARKLHGVLKVPRSYLGQDDAVPGKSILSNEDARAARVTMGIQREVRNTIRRLIQIDLAARGIDPFKNDLQVLMTVPSGIYELAHMEVKNARADFATRIQPFVSKRYILKVIFKMSDDEIDQIDEETKKDKAAEAEQQGGAAAGPAAGGPLQMPDTSGALSSASMPQPPGDLEIGPPPGTAGRPNTAGEWKNYDNARRLEEKKDKMSEKRHDEIMDTLGKVLIQDKGFAARLSQSQSMLQEIRHAAFARNGNGQLIKAPRGRGHRG